jgi:hypothetical protein
MSSQPTPLAILPLSFSPHGHVRRLSFILNLSQLDILRTQDLVESAYMFAFTLWLEAEGGSYQISA